MLLARGAAFKGRLPTSSERSARPPGLSYPRSARLKISGAIAVGYDRGVSTGAETTYTDIYTLSGGVSFKANKMAELRFGGVLGYWTDGDQSISEGSYYDATVGDDFVYGVNASMRFTF